MSKVSIVFMGYAPVHFICFRPLFERLSALAGVEVFVSGGLRHAASSGFTYNGPSMYKPFGIPEHRILSVDDIQDRRFDALFFANKRQILPRENVASWVQFFHGVSFRNRGVRLENLAYDTFFLIGPYMHHKFVEAGLLAEDDPRGIPIGFPKTNALLNGKLDRQRLLARYGFDGQRPILLYAPTGEMDNSLETMGKKVISHLTSTGKYDLLIKPHDHPKNSEIDWSAKLIPFENPHTQVVRDPT